MADNLQLNEPTSVGATIRTDEIDSKHYQVIKPAFGIDGEATMVSDDDPLPVSDAAVLAKLSSDPATQTTLAAILSKIIAAPSTEAKQDTIILALATLLSELQAKTEPADSQHTIVDSSELPSGAATAARQDTGNTSLASIDSKLTNPLPISGTVAISTALALEATLQSVKTAVEIIDNFISGARGLVTEDNSAAIKTATETIAGKDFATSAKQDTGNTSLSSIDGKLTDLNAKDFSTQTTLAAFYAALVLAQGMDAADASGPMMQGLVNDTPQSYVANQLQPISLTAEGRVRVSAVSADINRVWNNTFNNPFFQEDLYPIKNNYFNT